ILLDLLKTAGEVIPWTDWYQQNRKPASDEQKRRMKEMLRNGYTHAEAAEKLGLKYDEFGRLHQKPPKVVDVDEHLAALDEYINEFVKDGNHAAAAAFKAGSDALKGTRGASQISETRETYMSIEKRYASELRVGAALGGNSGGDEMAIEGYAARFNQQSKDLGGFRETVAPGAFTNALASNPDIRCLYNHDANRVLGRTTSGTLTLSQDENGLKFRCQLDPNNQEHRNLHSSIK